MRQNIILLLTLLILYTSLFSQQKKDKAIPPALASITVTDLKRDLYAMASDHFRGREAGTLDELKDAMWWANQLCSVGLQPAGDDGTYFQFFSMQRNRVSSLPILNPDGVRRKMNHCIFFFYTY